VPAEFPAWIPLRDSGIAGFGDARDRQEPQMKDSSPRTDRKYRPDIDGLRAISIFSVVAYHAGIPGFSGGFVGVDVFFVISGLLITSLLFNEALRSGRVNLGAFYARRVRRLMPAAFVVVALTLSVGAFVFPPASEAQFSLGRSAIAFSYFASNFYFFKVTGGYFEAPSYSMPLLHTWSLAVEEQYYLIWPLIMLLIFRLSHAERSAPAMRVRSLWVLGIMLVASLALCIVTTPNHQTFAFYLLPARVWEFAIGGMLGLAAPAFYSGLRRWADGLAVAGLALIVCSVLFLGRGTPFPGWAATVPVAGSALLIVGMTADEHGLVRRLMASKPMVFIGLLSYSWYLWHWPLLSMYRIYNLGIQSIPANIVLVLIALLLAWLTYVLVENPVRVRRPGPFRLVRPTLFVGLGIAVCTLLMGNGLRAWARFQKDLDENRPLVSARGDYPENWERCLVGVSRQYGDFPLEECISGPDRERPKVVLWGDSHAATLLPTLLRALPNAAVYQLTMAGCPPALGYEAKVPTASETSCAEFNRRAVKEITELKKKGLEGVVIAARWTMYMRRRSLAVSEHQVLALDDPQELARAYADMRASFDEMLGMLERAGVRVLVVAPNPEMVYPPVQCVGLRRGSYCDVPRSANESFLGAAVSMLAEAVSKHPNARLADLMDFFCDRQTCFAARDGKILYLDENHINAATARDMADFLRPEIDWLVSGRVGTVRP
jgi:peptidoglycan/LPS O-acetylase OafA/YrhL